MSEVSAETIKLADLVRDLGYRALIEEDYISTAMSGMAVLIFHWPCYSIQMYFGVNIDEKDGFDFDRANEVNRVHRFLKCHLTPSTLSAEQDFVFDITAKDAKESLSKIFSIWEISINTLVSQLQAARNAAVATVNGEEQA